jgi:hypothetical protein
VPVPVPVSVPEKRREEKRREEKRREEKRNSLVLYGGEVKI